MNEVSCYQKTGETIESSPALKTQRKVPLETHDRVDDITLSSALRSMPLQSATMPQSMPMQSSLPDEQFSSCLGNDHNDILLPGCTNMSIIEPGSDVEDSSLDLSAIFPTRLTNLQDPKEEEVKSPIKHTKSKEKTNVIDDRKEELLKETYHKHLPSKLYCPSCCKYTRTSVQIIASHNSWWSHLLCQICVLAPNNFKARHRCPYCSFTLLNTSLSN